MRALLAFGGLALAAWFLGIDRVDFLDVREARDAAISRAILESREPLTPVLAGEEQLDKPLLAYAPDVLGLLLTPDSPLGPRALKAVAAIALVALTGWIGAWLLDPTSGACAAAILASSLALPVGARTDGGQILGTMLGWAGWAGLVRAELTGGLGSLPLAYLSLAGAMLCSGPLAALWPIGAVAVHAALEREREPGSRLRWRMGLGVVAGLALPWYGAMLERHGAGFALRMISFPYATGAGDWFAAPARMLGFLVAGLFPWSALLPAAAFQAWGVGEPAPASRRPETDLFRALGLAAAASTARSRLLVRTLLVALLPLLAWPAPPLPAALPALPAAALLIGALLGRFGRGEVAALRVVAQGALLLGVTGSVAAALLVWSAGRLEGLGTPVRLLGAALLVLSWAPWLAVLARRTRAAPALFALMAAVGTPLTMVRILPELEPFLSTAPIAGAMEQVASPDAPLLLVAPAPPSLRLRTRRHLVRTDDVTRDLEAFRASDGYAYIAFPPARESRVARSAGRPLEILLRTPALILARAGPLPSSS